MSTSLKSSTISHYRSVCSRNTQNRIQSATQAAGQQNKSKQVQRLTFKDIQNITKSMLKDKTAHSHNLGVIHNIKGKMYCLKLGEVAQFKQFSHYFYTSQYRRKFSKAQSTVKGIQNQLSVRKSIRKLITQPSQNLEQDSRLVADNSEEIRRLHYGQNEEVGMLKVDNTMKQRINKFLFPSLNNEGSPINIRREIFTRETVRKNNRGKIL